METSLGIFEKKPQEEIINEQKLRYLASKVAICDHFGIPQAHYLALDTNKKSKMLSEYYKKLLPVHFGDGKNDTFFLYVFWLFFIVWILDSEFWHVFFEWFQKILFCAF